jgi:hypothetical protein
MAAEVERSSVATGARGLQTMVVFCGVHKLAAGLLHGRDEMLF